MPDAQRLVARGYKGSRQRIYLIQLCVDAPVFGPRPTDAQCAAAAASRLQQWQSHGVLTLSDFKNRLQAWSTQGHIDNGAGAQPRDEKIQYLIDVGFTFSGLEKLALDAQVLDIFRTRSPAFAEGAVWRAARFLGDTGPSASVHWQPHFQKDGHSVLLFVHEVNCAGNEGFTAFESDLAQAIDPTVTVLGQSSLLSCSWIEEGIVLNQGKEVPVGAQPLTGGEVYFGMRDGISSPVYVGLNDGKVAAQKEEGSVNAFAHHALGELLLGHARHDGSNLWGLPGAPLLGAEPKTPTRLPQTLAYSAFFRDGTFGALRKMRQDVKAFDAFVEKTAQTWGDLPNWAGAEGQKYAQSWVKAKMLGRWENGERMLPSHGAPLHPVHLSAEEIARITLPDRTKTSEPDAAPMQPNDFDFSQDREALGCPFGAHIRRMNPRNDRVVPFIARPLLRRGTPYEAADGEKGLLGLFLCASLEEQFEHLLGHWADNNPMGLPLTQPGKDPLIGNHAPLSGGLELACKGPSDERMQTPLAMPAKPFVTTRGTSYAFFPSVGTLCKIAQGNGL